MRPERALLVLGALATAVTLVGCSAYATNSVTPITGISNCGVPYTFEIDTRAVASGSCAGILFHPPTVRVRPGEEFSLSIMGEMAGPHGSVTRTFPVPEPAGSAVVITGIRGQRVRYRVRATGRTQLRVKSDYCPTDPEVSTCSVLTIVAS